MRRKTLRITLLILCVVISLATVVLLLTDNAHVIRGVYCTYLRGETKPDIDDMHLFDLREIPAGIRSELPLLGNADSGLSAEELTWIEESATTAFIVLRNDTVIFKRYFNDGGENVYSNSFSVAKSVVSLVIGGLLDEGKISNLDVRVGEFIPEYASDSLLTLRHLLQMTSGIPFGESYNSPFGYMARAYYCDDLRAETMRYSRESFPGERWVYEGGNTALIGEIAARAGGANLSELCSKMLWSKIGTDRAAYWNIDRPNGVEKAFTGIYATAEDFARIGQLMLHRGVMNGDTVVSPEYMDLCMQPLEAKDEAGEAADCYGLHFWIGEYEGEKFMCCKGMRGQYIVALPESKLVMVRLGHEQSKEKIRHHRPDMLRYISCAKKLAQAA
jgi:CubicO group peptidase (beta-lactamase class C family)